MNFTANPCSPLWRAFHDDPNVFGERAVAVRCKPRHHGQRSDGRNNRAVHIDSQVGVRVELSKAILTSLSSI